MLHSPRRGASISQSCDSHRRFLMAFSKRPTCISRPVKNIVEECVHGCVQKRSRKRATPYRVTCEGKMVVRCTAEDCHQRGWHGTVATALFWQRAGAGAAHIEAGDMAAPELAQAELTGWSFVALTELKVSSSEPVAPVAGLMSCGSYEKSLPRKMPPSPGKKMKCIVSETDMITMPR